MDRFTSQETNTKNGKGPFLRRWGFFLLLLTIGALHTVRSRSSKYGNSMEAEKNLTMSRHLRSLQSRELKKNRKETGTGDNDGGGTGGKGGGKGKGKVCLKDDESLEMSPHTKNESIYLLQNKATTVVTVTSTEVPVTTTVSHSSHRLGSLASRAFPSHRLSPYCAFANSRPPQLNHLQQLQASALRPRKRPSPQQQLKRKRVPRHTAAQMRLLCLSLLHRRNAVI